jgi:hypothetical protein
MTGTNGGLALAFRSPVIGLRLQVRADRRDVHKRLRARLARSLGDVTGALDMDPGHAAAENAAKIHDSGGTLDRVPDAVEVRDVGIFEAEPTNLAERLDEVGVAPVAARNAHPDAGLEEPLADVAADKARSAEYCDKLFGWLDHRSRTSPLVPRLTRRGGAP